jgi:hypothetical protein
MALVVADRVQETSVTSGTGTLTLAGAVPGYQTFSGAIGNGNTTFYAIYDATAQVWEVGVGTVGAGTLARTTVLSNSSGTTSPISLAGNSSAVYCTYPSEKSVNLDASGNVTPLGTIASGTWQGTTVGVSYGGTGVTASSGANSVVLRDANQNIAVNSVTQNLTKTVSAGGTTNLTLASSHFQILTGTQAQTYKLPDATSLPTGSIWVFDNDSTQNLTIVDNASGTVDVVAPGGYSTVFLEANGTVAGEWGRFGMIPSEVNWGTNSLDLGGTTVVTNGTWQGTPIASGYGGTGLTTFSAANYALYSTSASALTAGTLPIAAGGTGQTTANSAFNALAPSQSSNSGKYLTTDGTNTSWGTVSTGITIVNDVSSSSAIYPLFTTATSGTISTEYVSNSKLQYTPSSGLFSSPIINASSGIFYNANTVSSNVTIPINNNGLSVGPMTVDTGVVVTVASGATWTVM